MRRFTLKLRFLGRCFMIVAALSVLTGTVETSAISTPVAHAAQLAWEHPVPSGEISDGFRSRGGAHDGIDIAAPLNDPVNAPADLTITGIHRGGNYGTLIEAAFDSNNAWALRVGHCTNSSVDALFIGQQFKRGQQFAAIGRTGDATGPHAHIELLYDGELVDPIILTQGGPGPDRAPEPVQPPTDPLIEMLKIWGVPIP